MRNSSAMPGFKARPRGNESEVLPCCARPFCRSLEWKRGADTPRSRLQAEADLTSRVSKSVSVKVRQQTASSRPRLGRWPSASPAARGALESAYPLAAQPWSCAQSAGCLIVAPDASRRSLTPLPLLCSLLPCSTGCRRSPDHRVRQEAARTCPRTQRRTQATRHARPAARWGCNEADCCVGGSRASH